MRFRSAVIAFVVAGLLSGPAVWAQQAHVVDPAALRQAVADQAATDQQTRDALLTVLRRPGAVALAGRLGLSVTRAEGAVATLDSAELARLAAPARTADAALAGGSNTVVISTTTLLLVLIIVILLAN